MSTETGKAKKTPDELKPGDRFRAKGGPFGHRLLEVEAGPFEGKYGTSKFRCRVVRPVEVVLDYNEEVEVEARS